MIAKIGWVESLSLCISKICCEVETTRRYNSVPRVIKSTVHIEIYAIAIILSEVLLALIKCIKGTAFILFKLGQE